MPARWHKSTRRPPRRLSSRCGGRRSGASDVRSFELTQRQGASVLDVAELVEQREIMRMRTLPGDVIGLAPELPVVRRSRIGIERHGIIGPYAIILHRP